MDAKKLIKKLIEREDFYYNYFSLLAGKSKEDDFIKIFNELAQEEYEHKEILKQIYKKDMDKYDKESLLKIQESISYEKPNENLTEIDILHEAYNSQNHGYKLYNQLYEISPTDRKSVV